MRRRAIVLLLHCPDAAEPDPNGLQDLAGIESIERVERLLDGAHSGDAGSVLSVGWRALTNQLRSFRSAIAMGRCPL